MMLGQSQNSLKSWRLFLCLLGWLLCPVVWAVQDAAVIIHSGNDHGALACVQCHGEQLQGNPSAQIPRLRGQSEAYLLEQLQFFANGQRHNSLMNVVASHLQPKEMEALAQYLSHLSIMPPVPQEGWVTSRGRMLATQGNSVSDIPACLSCHGPMGEGVPPFIPALYGQPAAYLRAQLMAWRNNQRPAGAGSLMMALANRLSPQDVNEVSCYFASLSSDPSATLGCLAPHPMQRAQSRPSVQNDAAYLQQRVVDQGQMIFDDTPGNAPAYSGSGLSCQNCHLDHGQRAQSAPLWASYPIYPRYRKKNGSIVTFAQRMQNCFAYSLNGKAPPLGDPVLVALEVYAQNVSHGQQVGVVLPQHGYPLIPKPDRLPDFKQGQQVFAQYCALCHGQNGEGRLSRFEHQVFPPLWRSNSYNWGAGMARYGTLARFVAANMPYTAAGTLTNQQVWDVAFFIDAHERSQDPRYQKSVETTRLRYHQQADSLYGQIIQGQQLGGVRY